MTPKDTIAAVLREALPNALKPFIFFATRGEYTQTYENITRELAERVAAIPGLTIARKATDVPVPGADELD